MQKFDTSPGRNSSVNAGHARPAKASVLMPGSTARAEHECKPGSKVKAPAGFTGGIINGKV